MYKSNGMNIAFAKAGTEGTAPKRAEDIGHAVRRRTVRPKPTNREWCRQPQNDRV